MFSNRQETDVDRLARTLALSAGMIWERLETHPGYFRNRFRFEAEAMLRGSMGQARRGIA